MTPTHEVFHQDPPLTGDNVADTDTPQAAGADARLDASVEPRAPARISTGVSLASLTTLRLGGPARRLIEVDTAEEFVEAVTDCDVAGEPVLVLGGGSNLVIADAGYDGTVVRVATSGAEEQPLADGRVELRVAAGQSWDELVGRCGARGLAGLETLAGIPGTVGATPIQNVGAYGREVASVLTTVTVFDRVRRRRVRLDAAACGFGYRSSRFKREPDRWLVLDVGFALSRSVSSQPVRYAELAAALGVDVGGRAPLPQVREAVLALRRGKGMVVDPEDADSTSAGSFFTNPVVDVEVADEVARRADEVARRADEIARGAGQTTGATMPRFGQDDGRVKLSAAWLIGRAGFAPGHPGAGPVRISAKHTLALTHLGGGSTRELLALAREVRDGVAAAFGVTLENEPTLVGVRL